MTDKILKFLTNPVVLSLAGAGASYGLLARDKKGRVPYYYAAGGAVVGYLAGYVIQQFTAEKPAVGALPEGQTVAPQRQATRQGGRRRTRRPATRSDGFFDFDFDSDEPSSSGFRSPAHGPASPDVLTPPEADEEHDTSIGDGEYLGGFSPSDGIGNADTIDVEEILAEAGIDDVGGNGFGGN